MASPSASDKHEKTTTDSLVHLETLAMMMECQSISCSSSPQVYDLPEKKVRFVAHSCIDSISGPLSYKIMLEYYYYFTTQSVIIETLFA